MIFMRKFIFFFAILCLLFNPGMVGSSSSVVNVTDQNFDSRYQPLAEFLEKAGYPEEITKYLFLDARVKYHPNLVMTKVPGVEAEKILNQSSIEIEKYRISDFLRQYNADLTQAEAEYGVNKEIIAAIIHVETKIGHYTGNHRIFNILSSLALADQEFALEALEKEIKKRYANSTKMRIDNLITYYKRYARKKALMAKFELAHLVEMYINQNYNIMELRGSYAGAFGYCQFMPSSYIKYAIDGNGDNRIDLFNYKDAIYSVANYLDKKGWGNSYYAKRKALLRYNYSRKYVADVFNMSGKIRTIAQNL